MPTQFSVFSRYFISFNIAAIITFALFFSMQMLVTNGQLPVAKQQVRTIIDLGKIRDKQPVDKKIDKPVLLDTNDSLPPVLPTIGKGNNEGIFDLPVSTDLDPFTPIVKPGGSVFVPESDFLPIVKVSPRYPEDMASKGIEGFVRLKYTVTENGKTKDIVVVNSSHPGFERSAVNAARKFKFKPRVIDGEAVEVFDVYNLIEFKLDNQ
ncbi:MAG: energy transducer TonB [Alphaproteobacteria bacterium]|nr:energy transducer TonB [Alphaproteobacteria bacterium]HPF45679.1 energy transducer TonB [Emcibacteraceae bacterium]